MASIRERRTQAGKVQFAVLWRQDGKQTSRTFPTRKGAERHAALVDLVGPVAAEHQLGQAPQDVPSVLDHVLTYVNSLSGITEGTRSDYLSYARRDLGRLGELPITAVTREAVAKWVNELAVRLSGKSIKNRHSLLSAALTRAQRDELIPENPCKGVRLPRSIKRDMTFLTHGEFAQLLGHVPAYWQPLVTTLVGTGMRWGEATALAVKDCDLDAAEPSVRVRQAWKHTDGKPRELGPPKTPKARRTIAIDAHVVGSLRPLVEGRDVEGFVFLNPHGRIVNQSTFLVHVWQPAVRAFAGDVKTTDGWTRGPGKRPRVHDLRHTHVAWLIAAGVPLPVIQDRLGHESIKTTVDVYGHLSPGAGRLSAAATWLALSSAFPTVEGDDDGPPTPKALLDAGLEPDVESLDDLGPV